MEGLWYAHFTVGPLQGDGLAVLRNGEILGGDPTRTYTGSYREDGSLLYADVCISPYAHCKAPSELKHPIKVFLQGIVKGDIANVSGHADNAPNLVVSVELHRGA